MWKNLVAMLVVLLALGGFVSAVDFCPDCYSNIVTQKDTQSIDNVRLALEDPFNPLKTVAVGNEGLTAGVIVTKAAENPANPGQLFVAAPFARIDQSMDQKISNLGNPNINLGDGAKSVTWNKAIQAAWVANQGLKEMESDGYVKEGSYVKQSTTQSIDLVVDYDSREGAKVLNVDNKLAMIVDDMNAIIDLTASATSDASDTQSSTGTVDNSVNIDISSTDP